MMCFRDGGSIKQRLSVRGIRLATLANAQMLFFAPPLLTHIIFYNKTCITVLGYGLSPPPLHSRSSFFLKCDSISAYVAEAPIFFLYRLAINYFHCFQSQIYTSMPNPLGFFSVSGSHNEPYQSEDYNLRPIQSYP